MVMQFVGMVGGRGGWGLAKLCYLCGVGSLSFLLWLIVVQHPTDADHGDVHWTITGFRYGLRESFKVSCPRAWYHRESD